MISCVSVDGRGEAGLTSCSPTMTCTTLPFGTTCARSPNFTAPLPFNCTRNASNTSGLKRPPDRNCERSALSFSIAAAISVSRPLKSKGSSEAEDVEDEEELEASAREASRAALPPFFRVGGVLVKGRRGVLRRAEMADVGL